MLESGAACLLSWCQQIEHIKGSIHFYHPFKYEVHQRWSGQPLAQKSWGGKSSTLHGFLQCSDKFWDKMWHHQAGSYTRCHQPLAPFWRLDTVVLKDKATGTEHTWSGMCTDNFTPGHNYDREQYLSNIACGYDEFSCLTPIFKDETKN